MLNAAVKPVAVGGAKLRMAGALEGFRQFVEASGYAVAMMPNAKGFFPETHPNFMGIFWGPVSSPGTASIVESADVYLFAGPVLSDYASCGHTVEISQAKLILAGPDFVRLPGATYNGVRLDEFLTALAGKVRPNPTPRWRPSTASAPKRFPSPRWIERFASRPGGSLPRFRACWMPTPP